MVFEVCGWVGVVGRARGQRHETGDLAGCSVFQVSIFNSCFPIPKPQLCVAGTSGSTETLHRAGAGEVAVSSRVRSLRASRLLPSHRARGSILQSAPARCPASNSVTPGGRGFTETRRSPGPWKTRSSFGRCTSVQPGGALCVQLVVTVLLPA